MGELWSCNVSLTLKVIKLRLVFLTPVCSGVLSKVFISVKSLTPGLSKDTLMRHRACTNRELLPLTTQFKFSGYYITINILKLPLRMIVFYIILMNLLSQSYILTRAFLLITSIDCICLIVYICYVQYTYTKVCTILKAFPFMLCSPWTLLHIATFFHCRRTETLLYTVH